MFGIDCDKEFDGLTRIQGVEENGWDIDIHLFFSLGAKG
jgi:hypothetical protein